MSPEKLITEHLDLWTGAIASKSSSGRGSNSKIDLVGIKKLRALILELAVKGRLIPQEATDEPASRILERLANKAGSTPKDKAPSSTVASETSLPMGWAPFRVGDYLNFQYGKSLPAKERDDSGTVEVYGSNGVVGFHASALTNEPCIIIGRKGSAGALNKALGPSWTTDVAYFLHPPHGFDFDYTYLLLENLRLDELGKGIKPGVNRNEAYSLTAALPPLEEQRRIVQKVDELMALCDRLEQQTSDQLEAHKTLVDTLIGTLTQSENATDLADNWARLATHFDTLFTTEQSIDKLKKTILQLAVMGRLVEQDAGGGQAEELVIRAAQAKKRLNLRQSRNVEIAIQGEFAHKLPHSWRHVKVSDLFYLQNGYAFKSPWFTDKGVRLLRNVNISHGCINWDETVFLPEEMAIDFERFALKAGDLVISLDRPLIGTGLKYAIIRESDTPCLLLQRVARFQQYHEAVHLRFLEYWLNSELFTSVIDPGRSNGVPHISTGQIGALSFPLPPANEQIRIVRKVDKLIALCEKLKERLNEASDTRCNLANAIVEQAIS